MLVFRKVFFRLPLPQRLVPLLLGVGFIVTGLAMFGFVAGGLLEEWRYTDRLIIWVSIAFLCIAVGSVMLFFIFRARWRTARLLRSGLRAQATVLAVEPSWLAINDVTQLKVGYRFRDAEGRQHESSSGPMPPEETADWKAGDVGFVYYDPKRPTDTAWTGERQPPRQNADNRPGGRAL